MTDDHKEYFVEKVIWWYNMFGYSIMSEGSLYYNKFTTSSFTTCKSHEIREMEYCSKLVGEDLLCRAMMTSYETSFVLTEQGVNEAEAIIGMLEL